MDKQVENTLCEVLNQLKVKYREYQILDIIEIYAHELRKDFQLVILDVCNLNTTVEGYITGEYSRADLNDNAYFLIEEYNWNLDRVKYSYRSYERKMYESRLFQVLNLLCAIYVLNDRNYRGCLIEYEADGHLNNIKKRIERGGGVVV